jgi:uncharacterized protein
MVFRFALRCVAAMLFSAVTLATPPGSWRQSWDDALFEQAAKEHKFVLLDLHAVWCHWCHVMDETTYADAAVQAMLDKHYIAVSIDADSNPDLAGRYGAWGWPATIVLAADGTEIVKRRGYIPPEQMTGLLQAIVDDPSPGPSAVAAVEIGKTGANSLSDAQRAALLKNYDDFYDPDYGGWGRVHKLVDAPALELAYAQADDGNALGTLRARQTLTANLQIQDPVWGGVYQYSDEVDWRSPHFEKLLSYQAENLRLYAEAYARWDEPRFLAAADALYGYVERFLSAPDGGFYVSQDADLSKQVDGHAYYALDAAAREKLGVPRVDTHEYARETGWGIRALAKYYDVSGNRKALLRAQSAARWALAKRALPGGGFSHDAKDRGGPFLDDNVAMAQAFVALYRSTADRIWLKHASATLDFIDKRLRHELGFVSAPAPAQARGVFREPVRAPEQNAALARIANLLHRYTANARHREMAEHAMGFLTAYISGEPDFLRAEILLADRELAQAPIHIAIVGSKQDVAAQALHAAALRYPSEYLQVDWLDRAEGDLPNAEIQYPKLARAAAFACTDGACSSPVFEADKIAGAVRSALQR